jgi:hypothetical protein
VKITILLEDVETDGGVRVRLTFPNVPTDVNQLLAGVRAGRLSFEHVYSEPERHPGPVPDSFVIEAARLQSSDVMLRFHADPGPVDEHGRAYVYLWERLPPEEAERTPVPMVMTMCWACGQNRAVTRDGVFAEHGMNHDGSGERCRGSGTDGPPETRACGYCGRTVPLSSEGRFERHLGPNRIGDCAGTGRTPEDT